VRGHPALGRGGEVSSEAERRLPDVTVGRHGAVRLTGGVAGAPGWCNGLQAMFYALSLFIVTSPC
jgi:hypothetical protein